MRNKEETIIKLCMLKHHSIPLLLSIAEAGHGGKPKYRHRIMLDVMAVALIKKIHKSIILIHTHIKKPAQCNYTIPN